MQCDFVVFTTGEVRVNSVSPRKMEIQWDCRVTDFKGGTGGTDKGWEGELDQVHQKIRFDRQYLALSLGEKFWPWRSWMPYVTTKSISTAWQWNLVVYLCLSSLLMLVFISVLQSLIPPACLPSLFGAQDYIKATCPGIVPIVLP